MENNDKRTKILFVITKSNFGGAQKYVFDIATSLPADNFEVFVATGGTGILLKKLHNAKIPTISLSSLERDVDLFHDFTSFFNLLKIFCMEKPHVVHLNSAKAGGLGALAARLAGIPKIIFTAHGWAFNEDRSGVSKLIIKILSWVTVMLSHKTIAVSGAVKTDTISWPFIDGKVAVIRNGITEPSFAPRDEARTQLIKMSGMQIPERAFIVGTIAEWHKNKGLEYAVKSIASLISKHSNLYYFMLGNGEEKATLIASIQRQGMSGHVSLLNIPENASQYLSAFDTFILPSIKEGLPYVILEAGLASLPVIATTIGGIPEVIEHNKTGILVPPRDSTAIASALKRLIDEPSLRTTLGTALKEEVTNKFSFEKALAETITIYTKR